VSTSIWYNPVLEKFINNEGENTYTVEIIRLNGDNTLEGQLTMNGKWVTTHLSLVLEAGPSIWDANVVKQIYADEKNYNKFIDKTNLSGYFYESSYGINIIFKSCNTLFFIVTYNRTETIRQYSFTKIDEYIPTTAVPTTTAPKIYPMKDSQELRVAVEQWRNNESEAIIK
jgi:hypothetical protein